MFGGLKLGASLRAQAMRSLQEKEEERQRKREENQKREEMRAFNLQQKLASWDVPDPREDWEVRVSSARREKQEADEEANKRRAARAQASRARLARRERDYASARGERTPAGGGSGGGEGAGGQQPGYGAMDAATAPGAQGAGEEESAPPEYITLHVLYRGALGELLVTLTNEEHGALTVQELKQRIAAESGVAQHVDCIMIATPPGRQGHAGALGPGGGGKVLKDDWHCRNHLGDHSYLFLKMVQKESVHQNATREEIEDRFVRGQAAALWRGFEERHPPKDFTSESDDDLRKFLRQAGCEVEQFWDRAEMESMAKEKVPVWEVARVLSCAHPEQVLRVPSGAGSNQIKREFRRMSRIVHPDKNRADAATEAMYKVNNAYKVLNPPDRPDRPERPGTAHI